MSQIRDGRQQILDGALRFLDRRDGGDATSPEFDFWDRDEPVEKPKSTDDVDRAVIKDMIFKKWSTRGTFVVRSEGGQLIIIIGVEEE